MGRLLIILTTADGKMVGLSIRLMRRPGEISAIVNNIHVRQRRIDYGQNPAMFINSLVSIVFGGSGGREAPLVEANICSNLLQEITFTL